MTTVVLGIVKKMRSGKRFTFLDLCYGNKTVQVVADSKTMPHLTLESYVRVKGQMTPLPEGVYSANSHEVTSAVVEVISLADERTTTFCPPDAGAAVHLSERLYYFRDPKFSLVLRMISKLSAAFRAHFTESSCTEIHPPSFTSVECEGGASLFKLKHPGRSTTEDMEVFLTQSSQFALEYVLPGIGDCFCIAPSFRAEHSQTRRHLTEFTHVEAEWGGVLTFADHLDHLKSLLKGTLDHFIRLAEDELRQYGATERVLTLRESLNDIVILTHAEAIARCRELEIYADPENKVHFGPRDDIPEAQERQLIDTIGKVVFLVKFPKEFKSFYMGLDPEDPSYVLGCDVEVPGVGEIIGSGVREADYGRLHDRLLEAGLKPDDYREYLDLRRSGFCQTSGMGLGLGRMLCWLLNISTIRETTAFPRFPNYARP